MSAAIAATLVLGLLAASLLPLLRDPSRAPRRARISDLAAQRDSLVASLKDLDLDLAMGKISEEDHETMRRSLQEQAAHVLAEIDQEMERTAASQPAGSGAPAEEGAETRSEDGPARSGGDGDSGRAAGDAGEGNEDAARERA